MSYLWLKYLHIASAIVFVGIHGASMVVFYVVRGERERSRVQDLLAFSAKTVIPMYVSMGLVVATGVLVGQRVAAFRRGWGWWSIALLAIISILMWIVAKPVSRKMKAACELRPSGVPRVSDEELTRVLKTPRTHFVTAIGVLGFAGLLYLMMFKPF
jgi:uncharacterized membrane protein